LDPPEPERIPCQEPKNREVAGAFTPSRNRRRDVILIGVKAAVLSMAILLASGASAAGGGAATAGTATAARATATDARLVRVTRLPGGPRRAVLDAALAAYANAIKQGAVARTSLLTVIDYSLPSTQPRLWVLDLNRARVLYRELVAHGRASGDNVADAFSNDEGSFMSSLGLFVTDEAYVGKNGYSLRLRGLEPGINDHAYDRALVMHGAAYVSQAVADTLGRLGRSLGCPAVRPAIARKLIDTIKGGTVMYAYGVSHEPPASAATISSARH